MRCSSLCLITFLMVMLFGLQKAVAQVPASTVIGNILSQANEVEFAVTANEPFYVGSNVFLLHIGAKKYDRYRQTDVDGKGTLVFLIPKNEFHSMTKGLDIYLSYGELWSEEAEENEIPDACKASPDKAKYLGKLSAEMLSK